MNNYTSSTKQNHGLWTMDKKHVKPQNKQLQKILPEARGQLPAARSKKPAASSKFAFSTYFHLFRTPLDLK